MAEHKLEVSVKDEQHDHYTVAGEGESANPNPEEPLEEETVEEEEEIMICPLTIIKGKAQPCIEDRCAWYSNYRNGQCAILAIAELDIPENIGNIALEIDQQRQQIAYLESKLSL